MAYINPFLQIQQLKTFNPSINEILRNRLIYMDKEDIYLEKTTSLRSIQYFCYKKVKKWKNKATKVIFIYIKKVKLCSLWTNKWESLIFRVSSHLNYAKISKVSRLYKNVYCYYFYIRSYHHFKLPKATS